MVKGYSMIELGDFEKKVTEFSRLFTEQEYHLWNLAYTEENDAFFWSKRDKFIVEFYSEGLETDVRRRKNTDKEWFITAKEYLLAIQQRKMFQIKFYKNKTYGLIATVYLSSKHVGGDSYFEMLIVAFQNNALKIISSCLTDQEGYFDYHDGVEFDELPNPVKVIKFQPPSDPADLEEYNSE
jgi:hypothetical protein